MVENCQAESHAVDARGRRADIARMINGPAPRASFIRFRAATTLLLLAVVAILALAATPAAQAQVTYATTFNGGSGANDFVFSVFPQTDGRILIGGRFTTYDGVTRSGVARLNADGSLDTSFNPGTGTVGSVYFVLEQANGQILIAGDFTSYNGVAQSGIARLNADGTLDPTYAVGTGADGKAVFAFGGQVDGKLILGGRFTTFNGVPRTGVVRLNADGSVDTTFDPGTGVTGNSGNGTNGVYDVVVQPDGRILLGGYFNAYNGTQSPGIVRVNTDGSLDTGFAVGNGVARGNFAQTLALQTDGRIIVGGNFIRFGNAAAPGIARLNADGSIDTTFNAGAGAAGRTDVVYAAVVQGDGKVVVGGDFGTFNGVTTDGIVRLNTDGSVDTTFNTNGGCGQFVRLRAGVAGGRRDLAGGRFHDGWRFRLARRGAARHQRQQRERGRGDDQRESAEGRLRGEYQHRAGDFHADGQSLTGAGCVLHDGGRGGQRGGLPAALRASDDQGGRVERVVQRDCQSAGGYDVHGVAGEARAGCGHRVHGGQRAAVRKDQDRALIGTR